MTHSTGCAVCDAGLHAGADELAAAELAAEGMRRRAFLGAAAGAAVAFGVRPGAAAAKDKPGGGHHGGGRTLVLEPSWVLTFENNDLQLRRDHSVVVQDGRIAAITPGRVRGRETRLELPGQLLLPGLISSHTHVALGVADARADRERSRVHDPRRAHDGPRRRGPGRADRLQPRRDPARRLHDAGRAVAGPAPGQVLRPRRTALAACAAIRRRCSPNFAAWSRSARARPTRCCSTPCRAARRDRGGPAWGRTVNGAEGGRIRRRWRRRAPRRRRRRRSTRSPGGEGTRQRHPHPPGHRRPESATVKRLWGKRRSVDRGPRLLRRAADRCPHERLDVLGDPQFLAAQGQVHLLALPVGRRGRRGQRRPAVHRGAGGGDQHQRRPRLALQRPIENAKLAVLYGRPAPLADRRHQPRAGAPSDRLGHDQGGRREPGQRARATRSRPDRGRREGRPDIDRRHRLPDRRRRGSAGAAEQPALRERPARAHRHDRRPGPGPRGPTGDRRRPPRHGTRRPGRAEDLGAAAAEGWFTPTPR